MSKIVDHVANFFRIAFLTAMLLIGTFAPDNATAMPVDSDFVSISHHSAGDSDEMPADEHGSQPHHHMGCASHDVSERAAVPAPPSSPISAISLPSGWSAMALDEAVIDPALRPPIA